MSYINKRLFEAERVVYRGKFHWTYLFMAWMALIFLGVLVVGIFIFVGMSVHHQTTEFLVTDRRVIFKKGLFTARMEELDLSAVEGGHTIQGIFGRMFGFGDVHVTGRGETELDLPTMAHPGQFLAAVEMARASSETQNASKVGKQLHKDLERLITLEEEENRMLSEKNDGSER